MYYEKIMAVEIPLETNEELIFSDSFQSDKYSIPFSFAASNCAIFVSKEKHFAKNSWYLEKIPVERVKRVFLRKERSLLIIIISVVLLISGLIFTFTMMSNVLNQEPGTRVSGVPFAMIIAGLIIPFLARGRNVLVIESVKETFKWKPKLVVDKKSRNQIKKFQSEILDVCKHLGIQTQNESTK